MRRNFYFPFLIFIALLWGVWLSSSRHAVAQSTSTFASTSLIATSSNLSHNTTKPTKINIAGQGIPLGSRIPIATDLEEAHSVDSADFDQDGDQDLLVVSRQDGQIVWFENDGGYLPEFTRHLVAVVNGTYAVTVADFNHDGAMDFAVAAVNEVRPSMSQQSQGSIIWYQNNHAPDPAFTPHVVINTLAYPVSVQAADIDRDGDIDILSASRDDNLVIWYENNGAAQSGFTAYIINAGADGAVSVHFGDINGDGYLDILSASENDDTIAWYQNNRDRPTTFTAHHVRHNPGQPGSKDHAKVVFGADIDGDGDTDIVYGLEEENEVGWYENDGAVHPTFVQNTVTNLAIHTKHVSAIDFDRDGDMDIVSASSDDDTIAWYENNGNVDPLFSRHVIDDGVDGARYVHMTDLNRDGDLDLIVAARKANTIFWYPNQTIHRSALFSVQSVIANYYAARHLTAADIDSDGDMDLMTMADQQLTLHENQGTQPPSYIEHIVTTEINGGRWVQASDLDGDGDQDLISASKKDNRIAWFENNGASPPIFTMYNISTNALGARSAGVADIDNDGVLDVYSTSDEDDKVAWYRNNGARPPQFTEHAITRSADYVRSAYAADLDNDGDLDLMSASQRDNKVAWYRNQNGEFETHVIDTGAMGAQHIHADDMDGDGDIDILAASEHDNTIAWYENNGESFPNFQKIVITNQATAVHAVYTGDADQDGDIDIFAAIEKLNTIAWYENRGEVDPTFAYHVVTDDAVLAHGISAADLDGDGDLDMLAASRKDDKFAWFQNQGGQYGIHSQRIGPEHIPDGQSAALLQIDIAHRGRAGDVPIALQQLDLTLIDTENRPLTNEQANQLMTHLHVYRNTCCDGQSDPNQDTLVHTISPVLLDASGRLQITSNRDDANTHIPVGSVARYFVVPTLRPDASRQTPNHFLVTAQPNLQTMRDHNVHLPLRGEYMDDNKVVIPKPLFDPTPHLRINEFMASNNEGLVDPDEPDEYPDWLEIYNSWTESIDLGGLYLSDNLEDPIKFRIPDGVTIPSKGYQIFYADDEPEQGPLHVNFKLRSEGESIGLFNRSVQPIDTYTFGIQEQNVSFGRHPISSEWTSLGVATPNGRNLMEPLDQHVFLPLISNQQ